MSAEDGNKGHRNTSAEAECADCSDSMLTVSVSVLVPGILTNQTVVAGAGEIRLSCQVGVVACYS